jgi:hypothetical protein
MMTQNKITSFKDATKKIKDNYIAAIITKASEYNIDDLDKEEMNEINNLISQLNNRTQNLVYSQFILNIVKKGVKPDSYKWLEKIAPQKLDTFIFSPESSTLLQKNKSTKKIDSSFPFPVKPREIIEKNIAENPFAVILEKTEKEEQSLFYSMYKNLLHVMIDKTPIESKEASYFIKDFIHCECSYTHEVLKKLLIKNSSNFDDEAKKDIAYVILGNQSASNIYKQYRLNQETTTNKNNSRLMELLKIINCEHMIVDKNIVAQFLFPRHYENDMNNLSYVEPNLSTPTLIKFTELANLNENEVKQYIFDGKGKNLYEGKTIMTIKNSVKNLKNKNRNIVAHISNSSLILIDIYNKIAKELNFHKIARPTQSLEELSSVLEKIQLDLSLQPAPLSKKIKI